MDLTTLEIQIFVSLALVLGAVFVALLTDFLKGNNEALRERNVELVVRQQERDRWLGRQAAPEPPRAGRRARAASAPVVAPPDAGPVRAAPKFEETAPPEIRVEPKPERWATEAELGEVDELADRIRKRAAVNPIERPMPLEPQGPPPPETKRSAAEPGAIGRAAAADLAQPDAPPAESVSAELERLQREAPRPAEAEEAGAPAQEEQREVAAGDLERVETVAEEHPVPSPEVSEPPEVPAAAAEAADEAEAEGAPAEEEAYEAASVLELEPSAEEPAVGAAESPEPRLSWTARVEQEPVAGAVETSEPPAAEPAAAESGDAAGEAEKEERKEEKDETEEESTVAITGEGSSERPLFGKVMPIDALLGTRNNARDASTPTGEVPWSVAEETTAETETTGEEKGGEAGAESGALPAIPGLDAPASGGAGLQAGQESEPAGVAATETTDFAGPDRTLRLPGAATRSLAELQLPAGFHDYSVFAEALSSAAVFQGTVVALSVTGVDEPETLKGVEDFVRSLLTSVDFACRSGKDEFLLILPGETGAASQRRLQYISQRLWDYQIRSVAQHPIMFSWGAADMTGVALSEVVSAARDRMWQTRRSRERATAKLDFYHRRVANET